MQSIARISGGCWVAAAFTFWLAWFLMPLPGTTDAAFILEQVGATPERVWASVVIQLVSSALFIPALLGLCSVTRLRGSGHGFAAATLFGVGVTGFAADAIYHLVAYEMVLPGVTREAMLPVMERFQSADLPLVAPQLVMLLAGAGYLAWSAARAGAASRRPLQIFGVTLALVVAGAAAVNVLGVPRRFVALTVLAAWALSLAVLGLESARARS